MFLLLYHEDGQIVMEGEILFSEKNKNSIINLSSDELPIQLKTYSVALILMSTHFIRFRG